MQALAGAAQALAAGKTGIAVPGRERRDEIGEVAQAMEVLRQGTEEAEALRAAQAESRAAGERDRREATLALAGQVERSIGKVGEELAQSAAMLQQRAQGLAGNISLAGERGEGAARGAMPPPAMCRPWRRRPRNSPPPSPRSRVRWPMPPASPAVRWSAARRRMPRCRACPTVPSASAMWCG
ncbi:HAMP domain-containing protein [Pseudoroseomonas wenyumeiae]